MMTSPPRAIYGHDLNDVFEEDSDDEGHPLVTAPPQGPHLGKLTLSSAPPSVGNLARGFGDMAQHAPRRFSVSKVSENVPPSSGRRMSYLSTPPVHRASVRRASLDRTFEVTNYGSANQIEDVTDNESNADLRNNTPSNVGLDYATKRGGGGGGRRVSVGGKSPTLSPQVSFQGVCPDMLGGGGKSPTLSPQVSFQGVCPDMLDTPSGDQTIHNADRRYSRVVWDVARQGKLFGQRKTDRLFEKSGVCRISYGNVKERRWRSFVLDFFTTALELRWRYHVISFLTVFIVSWVFFAIIWWLIVNYHPVSSAGDIDSEAIVTPDTCISGVDSFLSALLFSIETQHTIGYGTRAVTTSCPTAVLILIIQSLYGVAMQCVLTGIFFAKLTRPRRGRTLVFSDKAAICRRDGDLWLMFRVGDIRKSQLMSTSIRALYVSRHVTEEGEELPLCSRPMHITTETEDLFFFLAWPIIVVHKIDMTSPLWNVTPSKLLELDFEIVVVLECVAEQTGAATQARTSYLPGEIVWGERLEPLVTRSRRGRGYSCDYSKFHSTCPVEMSEVSAKVNRARRESTASACQGKVRFDIISECSEECNNNSNNTGLNGNNRDDVTNWSADLVERRVSRTPQEYHQLSMTDLPQYCV